MRITVFTPAYNRAYRIETLYQSLRKQTFRDFEWIVVDDGSTDNTKELFACFQNEENDFPIRYEKTSNGGKHRAINRGVSMAEGELFFIVDSDDYLTDNALETVDQIEKSIPSNKKQSFAGVCGQRGYTTELAIGSTFSEDIIDATSLQRCNLGIKGDKAEVFYTDVLRRYPFPEFPGENFITECVVWDKIAADGLLLRFFNEIIYICEYLPDGLTAHEAELFYKNPWGHGLYLYQTVKYRRITGLQMWNLYYQFYRKHCKDSSLMEISKYIKMNPIRFVLRMRGLDLFYKLYD